MIFNSGFEVFREVVNQGSFIGAANALGISAPAVSKQIKSLENRLGLLLFYRTTRNVTLTDIGKQLFDTLDSSRRVIWCIKIIINSTRTTSWKIKN